MSGDVTARRSRVGELLDLGLARERFATRVSRSGIDLDVSPHVKRIRSRVLDDGSSAGSLSDVSTICVCA